MEIEAISLLPDVKEEFKFLWSEELESYDIPVEPWLIEKLIRPGSINILAGQRATAKSWIALALGYSLASGKALFGKHASEQSRVLYLDKENSYPELKSRQKMVMTGLELAGRVNIAFLSETSCKLDNLRDLMEIERFVLENQIKLIIADTYRRFIKFKENDADEVSKFFVDDLKPFCQRTGCAVLLVHHVKKGESSGDEMDMLRGSSDLANYVDSIFQIKRRGSMITFMQTKNRNAKEIEPFKLKIETDELSFFRLKHEGKAGISEAERCVEILKAWFVEKEIIRFKTSQAREVCDGVKKNTLFNSLSLLLNEGWIKSLGLGVYEISSSQDRLLRV